MKPRFGPMVLAVLIGSSSASAQTWVTTTEDYITDQIRDVVQTRDGRFLGVADTGRALALIKRNSDGSLLWQRLLMGSPTGEGGSDVLELPDGRIVAAGRVFVNAHGNTDMGWAILSPDAGTVLVQRAYGGPEGDDRALDLVATRDGGYLLLGETLSWGGPGRKMLAVKVDRIGDLEWARAFGSPGIDDVLYSGVEVPIGGYLVAGSSGSILRLGSNGELVWSRNYGLTASRQIAPVSDGNLVVVGWRAIGDKDAAEIVKLDATGEILWRASYGQTGVAYRLFTVLPLEDGGYLAGGEINGPGFTDLDGWLVRLNAAGDIVWQRHLNDGGGEVHALAAARDGSFVVGGHRQSFPQMMMARVDSTGQVSSCALPVTQAVRLLSGAGWSSESRQVIDPATLAVIDTNKPVQDAPFPENRLDCQGGPTYPPSEVSPPAASRSPLLFEDERTLVWEDGAPSSATRFDLYRGTLAGLRSGTGPGCLIGSLALNLASDADAPPPGAAFAYLVAGRNATGIGTLGHSSDGVERIPTAACD